MARRKQRVSIPRNAGNSVIARFFRRRIGLETLCDRCSGLFVEKPESVSADTHVHGSAVASVFVERRYGRKHAYVRLNRHRTNGKSILLSEYLDADDIDDAIRALIKARTALMKSQRRETIRRQA